MVWHTAPMADTDATDDGTGDAPSLEMPSFPLRRKRKAPRETEMVETTSGAEPADDPAAAQASDSEPRPRRELPTIALSGIPAAAATGVVVGGLAVLLAWLSTNACDLTRGTSSCGGGPGLLILVIVLVALAYAGSVLLHIFSVPDAGSTSILAVGILAVLVLVFLLGSIDQWWMVVAIPLAAVIAYCGSWWVTTAVVGDDAEVEESQPRDVR